VSQGLVLIYRGAGIINFAQGAVGMVGALAYFELHDSHGVPQALAFVLALAAAAALGVAIHFIVMRPLAGSAPLVRLISTLAILVLLLTLVEHMKGGGFRPIHPVLPSHVVRLLSGAPVGVDRYILLGVAVAVTIVLDIVFRRTRLGLATTAVSENTRSAEALAISPNRIAALNWAAASTLSALAAILISSLSGAFNPQTLTFLVIPALAAALVGAFSSFWLALAGGLAIGIAQSEMGRYISSPGWATAGPFLVIVIVLVVRGRALPIRGEIADRATSLGSGLVRRNVVLMTAAVVIAAIWFIPTDWVDATTTTAIAAVVALSVVVVAGYAGQLSLAQYTLAGMGAWVSARLVAAQGLTVELAAVIGIAVAVGIGVIIGLTALRSRGQNLAIATLGAAVALEQVILLNSARTGGNLGTQVGNVRVFGVDIDSINHPQRYATFVVVILGLLMLMVANLRRSKAGQRLVAIRANERAAASLGVGVFGAKLYAFGLGSAIAAVGGILMAFRFPSVVFDQFTVLASITVVMQAVVGGIGYIVGAVVAAMLQPASLGQKIINTVVTGGSATFILTIIGGVGALVVLIRQPDGIVSRPPWPLKVRAKSPEVPPVVASATLPQRIESVAPGRLVVTDLSVTFGGVQALNSVSLAVEPGRVFGLIGPNGSGKTTLIDAVTGFVRTSGGDVSLNGADIGSLSAVRRARVGIGRTFQSVELFPGMTVGDNLRVACDDRRRSSYLRDLFWPDRRSLTSTALSVARALELEQELDRLPDDLPFGRRRLVAIARSVSARPSVLLLDEPAAGLGPDDTAELGRLVRRLAQDMGLAVLVVEHDISLVSAICDQVAVLDRGAVIARGTPDEVLAHAEVVRAYLGADSAPVARSAPVAVGANGDSEEVRSVGKADAPVLAARNLDAGYGALAAVRGLDIAVRAGEVVALLGPNGAGKTTTLLTLSGALAPLRGEVLWDDEPVRDPLHRRVSRGLSLVTEERSVFPSLTTEANLRLGGGDVDMAYSLFPELDGLRKRKGGLLSGGEQQMLALARALARKPRVLLADELSLGLAPLVVARLFRAIRATAEQGVGVILVEQYTQRALEIADRVIVLNRGRVVLEAPAGDLVVDPDRLRRSYLVGAR
jgi:sulfate-transporting ATPase